MPFPDPLGWREHERFVRVLIAGDLYPQYLQTYCDFSLPSYRICLPLPGPNGCLGQGRFVSDEMELLL